MSMRLKQVWALGRFSVGASTTCIVNKRGPAAPVEPVDDKMQYTLLQLLRKMNFRIQSSGWWHYKALCPPSTESTLFQNFLQNYMTSKLKNHNRCNTKVIYNQYFLEFNFIYTLWNWWIMQYLFQLLAHIIINNDLLFRNNPLHLC